jgi:hypothetical protein
MDIQPGSSKAAPGDRELLAVVDFKEPRSSTSPEARTLVSDDQPSLLSVDPPMTNLDKIVLVIVVVGIIVFAGFQISQCVAAYKTPGTQTIVSNVTRTFPGIMLCPFSYSQINRACPKWAPEASLAFEFTKAENRQFNRNCSSTSLLLLTNTNVDPASQSQRSQSTCALNSYTSGSDPELRFENTGGSVSACAIPFEKQVTVKNSAKPLTDCSGDAQGVLTCLTCNSWTPPNVQCTVLDPSYFDNALNPICNPMKEVHANSVDALYLYFSKFGIGSTRDGVYSYSGLIPQPLAPPYDGNGSIQSPFVNAPSSLSITTTTLNSQGVLKPTAPLSPFRNVNMSLFGGIVAVLYDSSKGIPTTLDFDGARLNTMSNRILGSQRIQLFKQFRSSPRS